MVGQSTRLFSACSWPPLGMAAVSWAQGHGKCSHRPHRNPCSPVEPGGAEATWPPVPVEWQSVPVQELAFLHLSLLQMPMTFFGSAKKAASHLLLPRDSHLCSHTPGHLRPP